MSKEASWAGCPEELVWARPKKEMETEGDENCSTDHAKHVAAELAGE